MPDGPLTRLVRRRRRTGDLAPREEMPELRTTGLDEPLAALLAEVQRYTMDAIGWYLRNRRAKSRWSRTLRAGAISCAAAGGLIPLAAVTFSWSVGELGYLLLGLSAFCVAFDRLFGVSTAWMRYMTANLALHRHLARFRHAWVELDGAEAIGAVELRQRRLELIWALREAVATTIDTETQEWIAEFNSGLAQLNVDGGRGLLPTRFAGPDGFQSAGAQREWRPQPVGTQPVGTQPVGTQPVGTQPVEAQHPGIQHEYHPPSR